MKVFGIAGYKNAGKTTMIVELIREMRSRGLRVATIKHAHHDFDIDQPGKDSHQHRTAGAEEVIVASARRWAHIRELNGLSEPPLSELLGHLQDPDIVLIEGYKHGRHPKLELRRAGQNAPELAPTDSMVCLIVCDELPAIPASGGIPMIARSEVGAIADAVLKNAVEHSGLF